MREFEGVPECPSLTPKCRDRGGLGEKTNAADGEVRGVRRSVSRWDTARERAG